MQSQKYFCTSFLVTDKSVDFRYEVLCVVETAHKGKKLPYSVIIFLILIISSSLHIVGESIWPLIMYNNINALVLSSPLMLFFGMLGEVVSLRNVYHNLLDVDVNVWDIQFLNGIRINKQTIEHSCCYMQEPKT
ncbi:hypothetical protein ANCCAN_30148 [Ancylostoma caninum]|uniref:Uncharacterized protein n=1 Tax=Ancylostoma caninum TaxID=29170 RepID=A0A368EWN0_ANCCA|nr:hypothetical protein ANCCAN_30148 [Ancylostoma caninum]